MANLINTREILSFPSGDNSTDTLIGKIHFNTTTLNHFNYALYSNNTISNGTKCFLLMDKWAPALLLNNGTFVNATSCYSPINSIGARGFTGIGFSVAYGITLILILTLLAKHGSLYLPSEKRFYPIGRRWQWYWAIFVCATALISLFLNVDVDRYYLQELPIVVTVFFWFLMCEGTLALVWEAVRHWGAWQERQFIDPNPFIYAQDDKRAKIEFYVPLWFYFWTWMNFFLVVPRSWTFAELQRSPEQTLAKAAPGATDGRFKAAAFCLVVGLLTILFSLRHSIKHYKPRNRGVFNRSIGFVRSIPLRFVLLIPLLGALIAYQVMISFSWKYSLIKYNGDVPVMFVWGYLPPLLILWVQCAYGFASPNEDKELIRQRRQRGDSADRDLGYVKKPAWWNRVRGDHITGNLRDKISRNVKEVGMQRGIGRRVEDDMERYARLEAQSAAVNDDIEMGSMARTDPSNPRVDRAGARAASSQPVSSQPSLPRYEGKNERRQTERVVDAVAGLLFPNSTTEADRAARLRDIQEDGPAPPAYSDTERRDRRDLAVRPTSAQRNSSTSTTNSISAPAQQVRSMLDV